jgi:hypothetical protein
MEGKDEGMKKEKEEEKKEQLCVCGLEKHEDLHIPRTTDVVEKYFRRYLHLNQCEWLIVNPHYIHAKNYATLVRSDILDDLESANLQLIVVAPVHPRTDKLFYTLPSGVIINGISVMPEFDEFPTYVHLEHDRKLLSFSASEGCRRVLTTPTSCTVDVKVSASCVMTMTILIKDRHLKHEERSKMYNETFEKDFAAAGCVERKDCVQTQLLSL